MRLGLGQVLRYRNLLRENRPHIRAVLVAEGEPQDSSWRALCEELGVLLLVPPDFSGVGEEAFSDRVFDRPAAAQSLLKHVAGHPVDPGLAGYFAAEQLLTSRSGRGS